jgi:hypothetical protein
VIRLQVNQSYKSPWIKQRSLENHVAGHQSVFTLNAMAIYLFVSETPCGDASLDILSDATGNSIPWTMRAQDAEYVHFRGHEYIWEHGKVRFKPGIPSTMSLSQVERMHLNHTPNRVQTN